MLSTDNGADDAGDMTMIFRKFMSWRTKDNSQEELQGSHTPFGTGARGPWNWEK